MKKLFLSQICLFLMVVSSFAQNSIQGKSLFNDDWKFLLISDEADYSKEYFATNVDDKEWTAVSLPHTANIEPLLVNDQWQGICWYRKKFDIDKYSKKKRYFIQFEGAMNIIEIWINGKMVKKDQGGYLPTDMEITDYIKSSKNIIAVRLDNRDNAVTGPKPLKILDFNMYGGLYRNAYLIEKNSIYISNPTLVDKVASGGIFVSFPWVEEKESQVKIKTHLVNDNKKATRVTVKHEIFDGKKLIKARENRNVRIEKFSDTENSESIAISKAKLWSPEEPNLYTLKTTILNENDEVIDSQTTRFGIRVFEFKDTNDLYINGKKTFLRGVNRHQEYPFIGYALSDNAQYRDAYKIKQAGFNYIRLSHYPQSPAFMEACDELGLVVADAILGWQFYPATTEFDEHAYYSARKLIRRDRNYACVLSWEVSLNETKMPIEFMANLDQIVHDEYPGKNVYSCGWMNDVYDIYFQARQHRILHKDEMDFSKPYMVSEYGDWEYYSTNAGLNQHQHNKELRYELSSRQLRAYGEKRLLQQAYNLQESHNDNLNYPVYADGYWVMYDYNRGYHHDIESSGIMDIFRLPKFAYSFYGSQADMKDKKSAVLDIATYWDENSPTDVKVYSNAEEVELFLNDESLGRRKPDVDDNTTNLSHPPFTFVIGKFTPGTLRAVAYVKEKEIKTSSVTTPGKAVALKCWVDESGRVLENGVNDVAFLYIAAVDANGTICNSYTEDIKVTLPKGIELMNEGGNIYTEAGIATALIRIGEKKGGFNIEASATDGLTGKGKITVK